MRSSTVGREFIKRVLELMREWGWDTGIEKLKAELEATESENERPVLQLFVGWIAGERGLHAEALKQMRALKQLPRLKAWALVGQAFVMLRKNNYKNTHKLLDEAAQNAKDPILLASIAHCRGSAYYHQGRNKPALEELRAALSKFGRDHFCTGRVLDAIGMVYSSKNHFHAAREFYSLALKYKERQGDEAGRGVTLGQLGRLYMDWEQLDQAEIYFRKDLELSQTNSDIRGEALLWNHLGQISIARKHWDKAVSELEQCLQRAVGRDWNVIEGFARKDLARALLGQNENRKARSEIEKSRVLFRTADFPEGLAHLSRVEGMLFRAEKKFDLSESSLREALRYFEQSEEHSEAARTQFEIARTLRSRGSNLNLDLLKTALDRAEKCRRDALVREIENELKSVDELEYHRRIYQRARGRNVEAGTESLFSGKVETLTVLFLDVQGSTEYAKDLEPEDVMITMNQMTAEFVGIMERHGVRVSGYRGDGFMAMVRERSHARRAVMAALEMVQAMKEFNAPRELIREYEDPQAAAEMKPLSIRIGIATGEAFLGNIGTYDKMDFTALGTTCNLGARLESQAQPLIPRISEGTYERVRNDFQFSTRSAKLLTAKGLEDRKVRAWDVLGPRI